MKQNKRNIQNQHKLKIGNITTHKIRLSHNHFSTTSQKKLENNSKEGEL